MIAIPAQTNWSLQSIQLHMQTADHAVGITQMAQIDRQVFTPCRWRSAIELLHILRGHPLQVQGAMVLHRDGKDKQRFVTIGTFMQQLHDFFRHGHIAHIRAITLGIDKVLKKNGLK